MKILRADFEQIELVVAAVYHKEPKVLEAIHRGVDLHVLMASQIFGIAEKDVTEKHRDGPGKLTNLSRLYGTGLDGFVQRARLPRVMLPYGELEAAYCAFDDLWVNLANYRERIARTTAMRQHKREIRSMYGRRILLDEALSLRELRGAFLNYPIQTTASDLLKVTMLFLLQGGATILASVHDEILVVAPFSKLKVMEGLFREAVAQAARAVLGPGVPVRIEIGIGRTWWEASLDAKQKKQQRK